MNGVKKMMEMLGEQIMAVRRSNLAPRRPGGHWCHQADRPGHQADCLGRPVPWAAASPLGGPPPMGGGEPPGGSGWGVCFHTPLVHWLWEADRLPSPVSWECGISPKKLFFRKPIFSTSNKSSTKITHLQQLNHAKLHK